MVPYIVSVGSVLEDEPDYVGVETNGGRHSVVDVQIGHLWFMTHFEIFSEGRVVTAGTKKRA